MDTFKTPNSDESLASYVSRVRKKLNLTQSELADAAGIHGRSVGKIERGLTLKINRRTLQGLAIALGVPQEYFDAVIKGEEVSQVRGVKFCPNVGILARRLTLCGVISKPSFVISAVHRFELTVRIAVSWCCL